MFEVLKKNLLNPHSWEEGQSLYFLPGAETQFEQNGNNCGNKSPPAV